MEKTIEIPFGAKDSELKGWEYTIPENMEAEIKDGKIIVKQKESEDEKIRKILIHIVKGACDKYGIKYKGDEITEEKLLAYLEKQKEQNQTRDNALQKAFINSKIDYTLEEKCDASDYAETILPTSVTYGEGKEEYKLHKIIEAAFIAGQKKEQKPAVKQDYSDLNDLERAIHRGFLSAGVENVQVAIIKETAQECLAQMKPAEWSEEDEKFFKTALWHISYSVSNGKTTDDHCDTTHWLKGVKERLKSLRPQPHWKPSEEQMEALKDAFRKDGGNEYRKVINSLYCDLQKLL